MRFEPFAVGPLMSNCYLVYDRDLREGAMIDLGCWDPRIAKRVMDLGLQMRSIYLTHGHFDHIDGSNTARGSWPNVSVRVHPGDMEVIQTQGALVAEFLPGEVYVPPVIDAPLEDGEVVRVGSLELTVAHTPGHTPGSVCFIGGGFAFTGDTLFAGGVGRVDLPGSDEDALFHSIRERLLDLPGETRVLSGHGPETTIAHEITTNPWLQGGSQKAEG